MSLMGIGTNTLGYGHPEVDEAVRQTIAAGNMSTLNCPEEVYLAERLVGVASVGGHGALRPLRRRGQRHRHPHRPRGRAGRDKVAICGYHGWHDWYLAANLGDEQNLAGHLLPGSGAERRAAGPARQRAAVPLQQFRRAGGAGRAITTSA